MKDAFVSWAEKHFDKNAKLLLGLVGVLFVAWYFTPTTGAATYTWDGGGSTNDWSECANWSSNTCPTSADIAQFNATSVKDATIDATFAGSVLGVSILSGYTGTITQSRSLTVGSSHFNQAAGTYAQGNQNITNNNSFTVSGGTYTAGTGTITFPTGSNSTTFTCTGVFPGNLIISRSSAYSFTLVAGCEVEAEMNSGAISVFGTLTATTTTMGGYNVTVQNGGVIDATSVTSIALTGALTVSTNGILTAPNATSYTSVGLILQASSTFTNNVTNFIIDGGDFTLDPAATFTASGKTFTFTDNPSTDFTCTGVFPGFVIISTPAAYGFTLVAGCEIEAEVNNGALSIYGTLIASTSSMVASNVTVQSGGFIDATSVTSMVLSGTLTVTAGETFDAPNATTFSGDGISLQANSTFNNNVSNFVMTVNFTMDPTANFTTSGKTFTFQSSGSTVFTCTGTFLGTVITTKSSAYTFNIASGCEITVGQNVSTKLTINGTLNAAGYNLNAATTVAATGVLKLQGTETVTSPSLAAGSTVNYVGSGSYSVLKAGSTYSNLSFTGSGTFATSSSITVARNFTQTAGTFNHTGTLNLTGTSTYAVTTSSGSNLNHLTLNGSGGTYSLAGSGLNLAGNLTITAGTLDASASGCSSASCSIYLAGNWNNSGSFTARNGAVIFDGTGQSLTGNTTFYNLTKSVASADTLTFTNGQTFTVNNTLSLHGASGQLLSLRSSSNGSQWNINPKEVRSISYLDVKDSNNINAVPIATDGYSITNSLNNTNWFFYAGAVGIPETTLSGSMKLLGGVRLR